MVWSLTLEERAANGLDFYKRELARLRDLHRGLWKLYLPASLPGAAASLVWAFRERAEPAEARIIILPIAVLVWIVVMLRHETQEAKRFQRELDALETNR